MRKFCWWFAIACVLYGCGSIPNGLAPEKLDLGVLSQDSAVIILSTGAAERCVAAATMLQLAPAESPYGENVLLGLNVDAYVVKSDFADHQGSLSAFVVKPGNYQLYPFTLNPYIKGVNIPKAEFTAAPGEVVYIGEFYMPVACSFEGLTQFRDQGARDLSLLQTRNPNLADKPIVTRIAKFSGYILGEK